MNKKNKKYLIVLVVIAIIIITIGIIINFYTPTEEATPKESKVESKQYTCNLKSGNEKVTLENIYEFTYEEDIKNYHKKFIVTYKDIQEYNEAFYDNFFNVSAKPDEIQTDDTKLQRIYIWNEALDYDKKEDVESYLKTIESYGYQCSEIK